MASRRRATPIQRDTIFEESPIAEGFVAEGIENEEQAQPEPSPEGEPEPSLPGIREESKEPELAPVKSRPVPNPPKKTEFIRKPRNVPRFS
jgi:hypothetical protein